MTPSLLTKNKNIIKEDKTLGEIEKRGRREFILLLLLKGNETKSSITRELKYKEKKSSWISGEVNRLIKEGYVDQYRIKGNYFDYYRLNLKILFEYVQKNNIQLTESEKGELNSLFKRFGEKGRERIVMNYLNKGIGTIARSMIFSFLEYFVYQTSYKKFMKSLQLLAKFDSLLYFDAYEDPSIFDDVSNKIAEKIENNSNESKPKFYDSKDNLNYESNVSYYAEKIAGPKVNIRKDTKRIKRIVEILSESNSKKSKELLTSS